MRSNIFRLAFLLACQVLAVYSLRADWEPTNGPFAASINALHTDGSTLIAGTSTGIYRSTDIGGQWVRVAPEFAVQDFCAAGSALYAGTLMDGIIVSHDAGQTWEKSGTPPSGDAPTSWVGTLAFHRGKLYASAMYGEVHVSSDSGRTWTLLNEGLPMHYNSKLVVANDRLFIAVGNDFGGTEGGVFILDGDTWIPTSLRDLTMTVFSAVGSRLFVGGYNVINISDNNGETWVTRTVTPESVSAYIGPIVQFGGTLFAGTGHAGIWTSDDNGETWSQNVLTNISIAALATIDNTLIAGTLQEGIFATSNSGISWEQKNTGLISTASIPVFYADEVTLYTADEISGTLFRSTDQGATWHRLSSASAVAAIAAVVPYNNRLILASRYGGIFISTDEGATWQQADGDLDKMWFNVLIALDNTILAGAFNRDLSDGGQSGLMVSDDAGATWQQADLPSHVYAFVQHGGSVYAGTPNGLFSSDDGGHHWTARNTGLPRDEIYALASSGTALFASFFREGVYVSENNGESWRQVTGLPDTVRVDVFTSFENYVFAGSSQSVYMTSDNGLSWTRIDPIGNSLTVRSLANDGEYLYAGTNNRAVWRRPLSDLVTTSVTEPIAVPAFLLYPQPATESAVLELCNSCALHDAVLTLMSLDGRQVRMQPQVYGSSVRIDRAGLPAGAYIFTLVQDNRVVVTGTVIMK